MKPLFYLLFLPIFFLKISSGNAQITYQASDYGSVGDTFLLSNVVENLTEVDFLTTGANQVWNFSQLQVNTQSKEAFLGDTGYYFSFLASCFASGGGFQCFDDWNRLVDFGVTDFNGFNVLDYGVSNVVRHQKKQNNVLREGLLGLTIQTGGLNTPLTIRYANADTVLRFPLNYQNQHNDYSEWMFDLNFLGIDVVYKHTQTRLYTVDGWGALTTPFQTYPATLRVRTEIVSQDTIFAYGNVVPTTTRTINLAWYSKDTKRPVLEVFGAPIDALNQEFVPIRVAFVDTLRCLEPSLAFLPVPPFALLNPQDSLVVNFLSTSQNVDQFFWNFGDGTPTLVTVGNPRHTYYEPGTYNVTAVGCNSNCLPLQCDTATFTLILANPNQPVTSFVPNPFSGRCEGDSIAFINLSFNAQRYLWDFGDGTTDTTANPIHVFRNSGNYTVRLTAENNGVTGEASTDLRIFATPPAPFQRTDTSITLQDTLILQIANYPNILWQDGSTAPSFRFIAADYGVGRHAVSVAIADTTGCSTRDTIFVTILNATSVTNVAQTEKFLRIYPNPATEVLQLESLSPEFSMQQVVILDMLGKRVLQQIFSDGAVKIGLTINNLPPGMYVVQVRSKQVPTISYKWIKR